MQRGQIVLAVGTILLALALYFAGRTVPGKEKDTVDVTGNSFDTYLTQQELKLGGDKPQWQQISSDIKSLNTSDSSRAGKIFTEAAAFWKLHGNNALSAYYLFKLAESIRTKSAYVTAADSLVSAFKSGSDSTISNNLITFALRSYQDAVQLDNSDIGLKIKLADVYVQGSQEPMKGIMMLRQLADSLPENVPVQLALGRLSIQSGQLDKAKDRLQAVLKIEPQNTEALYFLAITEAQLGHNDEAIRLFEMCKLLIGNDEFSKEIDEIVKNLKNKKV